MASPSDIPEGASPRTWDTDFLVGSVITRPGEQSEYSYAGSSFGPFSGGAAFDVPLGGTPWSSPSSILLNDGSYASVTTGSGGSQSSVGSGAGTLSAVPTSGSSNGLGAAWITPGNVNNPVSSANCTLAVPGSSSYAPSLAYGSVSATASAGSPVVTNFTALGTFPSVVIGGAAVTLNLTMVSSVGGAGAVYAEFSSDGITWGYITGFNGTSSFTLTGLAGLTNLSLLQIRVGATAAWDHTGGPNTNSASISAVSVAIGGGLPSAITSQTLLASPTGLIVPAGANILGFAISFKAFYTGSAAPNFAAQLSLGGYAGLIGAAQPVALTNASSVFTIGGNGQLWGYGGWTSATFAALGIDFNANVAPAVSQNTVSISDLSVTVWYSFGGMTLSQSGGGAIWQTLSNLTSTTLYTAVLTSQFRSSVVYARNGGFSIPPGATISGIEVTLNAYATGGTIPPQISVAITSDGSTPLGSGYQNNSVGGFSSPKVYGGPIALWADTALTPAVVNNPAFGVLITAGCPVGGATVFAQALAITIFYQFELSDGLAVTQFGFNLSPSTGIVGIQCNLKGICTAGATISAQLMRAGIAVGLAEVQTLSAVTNAFATFGGATDPWGSAWSYADLNNTGFGVEFRVASSTGVATINLDYASITVFTSESLTNFTYVKTFETEGGLTKTLALDGNGNLWLEDVANTPGELSLLLGSLPAGSYAKSVTQQEREYVCFSDLRQGTDVPRQYTGDWIDRVTQVGPAAAPSFIASQSSGASAAITNFAIASNVATLTAANAFTAGEVVTVSGMGIATYLNGLAFSVSSIGLSGTAFQVAFTHTNVGSTADTGTAIPQYSYPIAPSPTGITQNPQQSDPDSPGHFNALLWSSGPGSVGAGNTITVYYKNAFLHQTPDLLLTSAISAGDAVYVYIAGAPFGNGTQMVTSVGMATPPHGAGYGRYYFTYNVPTSNYQFYGGPDAAGGTYQMTVATLTAASPIPGVSVGDNITITGAGVANWNASWPITKTLNSGAYAITQTSVTTGTATYSWTLISGSAPTAGELVTVTGTLNANGALNAVDALIATVAGTVSGTFTLSGFPASLTAGSVTENGQATTAGTQFEFDPGVLTLGTNANPIYGNSGGGLVSIVGSTTLTIGSGTRQGTVIFETRNGAQTAPAPPVTFTTPNNSNYIYAANIPLGPPNTVARVISFTEAGANLVPGANFYTIPQPVQFIVAGVKYLSSSLRIEDNTTTSAKFTFNDGILLAATAIDVQGNNLFNQIELGDPVWNVAYAGRMFYGLCRTKIQNFLNLSFDGGYLPSGGNLTPLGWQLDGNFNPTTGTASGNVNLLVSPTFGNSFYILNSTGSTQLTLGMITQTAFEDAYQQPILLPNVAYSVRVTCRCPSGIKTGSLVVDLTSGAAGVYGAVYGTYTLPFSAVTSTMATYTGTLLVNKFVTVPADLLLRAYASMIASLADVEIDRIEIYPTVLPVNTTNLSVSYAGNLEGFASGSGNLDTSEENTQPCNGAVVMNDLLYLLKQASWYYTQDSPDTEPDNWKVTEISNSVGACGPNAYDYLDGEQWIASACRSGAYIFIGGAPKKFTQEIYQVWDAIYWRSANTVWLRNDIVNRRLLIGVPMVTPNAWLPNAPVNAAPQSPNVILMCNYLGLDGGEDVASEAQIHTTMMGNLVATDMRRKWSIWQIASPYADFIKRGDGLSKPLFLCNGTGSSKIYSLQQAQLSDDGAAINGLYTTYGFVNTDKAAMYPLLGFHRKRYSYVQANITGSGTAMFRFLPNKLDPDYPYTLPGGFVLGDGQEDHESSLNVAGQRVYVEVSTNAVGAAFSLSELIMVGAKDAWNAIRGVK